MLLASNRRVVAWEARNTSIASSRTTIVIAMILMATVMSSAAMMPTIVVVSTTKTACKIVESKSTRRRRGRLILILILSNENCCLETCCTKKEKQRWIYLGFIEIFACSISTAKHEYLLNSIESILTYPIKLPVMAPPEKPNNSDSCQLTMAPPFFSTLMPRHLTYQKILCQYLYQCHQGSIRLLGHHLV